MREVDAPSLQEHINAVRRDERFATAAEKEVDRRLSRLQVMRRFTDLAHAEVWPLAIYWFLADCFRLARKLEEDLSSDGSYLRVHLRCWDGGAALITAADYGTFSIPPSARLNEILESDQALVRVLRLYRRYLVAQGFSVEGTEAFLLLYGSIAHEHLYAVAPPDYAPLLVAIDAALEGRRVL